MQNIEMKVEKDKLILTVDLKKRGSNSKSGKSILVASTGGNAAVDGHPNIRFGLNVFAKVNGDGK